MYEPGSFRSSMALPFAYRRASALDRRCDHSDTAAEVIFTEPITHEETHDEP